MTPKQEIKKDEQKETKIKLNTKEHLKGIEGLFHESVMKLKKWNPIKSVGMKLFLIFLCSIIAIVLVLGLLSYNKAKSTIKNTASEANYQTIIQTAEKLDIKLEQYEYLTDQFFLDVELQNELRELMFGDGEYKKMLIMSKITSKLSNQVKSNTNITSISLIPSTPELDIITSGETNFKLDSIREQDWYNKAVANSKNYTSYYSEKTERTGIYWFPTSVQGNAGTDIAMLRSVNNMGKDSAYVMVFEIKNKILQETFKSVNLGDNSKIQLISPEGTVVASSVGEESGKPTDYAFIKESKHNNDSQETNDIHGKNILAVYNPMAKADWKLAGVIPTDALVKAARPILMTTFITAGAAAVLAVLIGLLMVRMIAHPLTRLKDLMVEGAKGNLIVRTRYVSKDEIGQLSSSFNIMMERIADLVAQTSDTAREVLETAGELGEASRKTAVSAKEIAVATEEIAGGAGSLAQEAERGNELSERMSTQMAMVITANQEMDAAARNVGAASGQGAKQLESLLEETSHTGQMTGALVERVNNLKETVYSVIKVLDVMNNITQQTNILSLNATIEAARAGEAGRGFMVVAGEVRQLADQSKQSIALVAGITDKIMTEMNETVSVLSEVAPLFKKQMTSVKNTSDIFVSVQNQMDDFISSLESVTESINSLSHSQSVSAVAEQSSATSEEVASLSSEQQSVSKHLVLLSGKLEQASGQLKQKMSLFTIE